MAAPATGGASAILSPESCSIAALTCGALGLSIFSQNHGSDSTKQEDKGSSGKSSSLGDTTGKTGAEQLKSLDKASQSEARTLLEKAGFKSNGNRTAGGWETFKHADGSRVDIGPGGRVVRTQAPKYGSDGTRINKGQRVDSLGNEIDRRIPHDQHPLETLVDW